MKALNLKGKRFGKLTVLGYSHNDETNHRRWKCQCDCGNIVYCLTGGLRSGHVKSCGCLMKKYQHSSKITHGMSTTRFYKIWKGMVYRCTRHQHMLFSYYGAKGIRVNKCWLKFENFRDDMYESYLKHCKEFGEKNTSIDRINNNGNYELSNCRWATWKEQGNNRNINHFVTYRDEKKTIAQWASDYGLKRGVLYNRIIELRWPFKKAILRPVRPICKHNI